MTDRSGDHGLAVPDHPATSPPAGWYPDPVRGTGWRWWNGTVWTTFVDGATVAADAVAARKPRHPRWLSVPVVICAPLVALGVVLLAVLDPVSALAGLVPLAIVLPVVSWLDRVEPEPRAVERLARVR